MTVRNLDKVLHPESVVVVGSGDIADTYGAMVMGNILEGGFEGPVWSVDPGRATFVGKDCFARVADLPAVPDLAVVAVVPEDVPGVIADLGAKGCRIAVVLTPGVKAEGGLRQRMLDAAKPYLLRIIGPDTLGEHTKLLEQHQKPLEALEMRLGLSDKVEVKP